MLRISALAPAVSVLCPFSSSRADDVEDKAVAFVEKLRGKVIRDQKAPGKPVIVVNLSQTKVTGAGLKDLAALKNLTTLYLGDTKVTDAGPQGTGPAHEPHHTLPRQRESDGRRVEGVGPIEEPHHTQSRRHVGNGRG